MLSPHGCSKLPQSVASRRSGTELAKGFHTTGRSPASGMR